MTDKKNIINPDEDFELDGLSNFVEDLNKEGDIPSLSKNENEHDVNSALDSGEEYSSFLDDEENDDFSLEELNLANDQNDEFEFDTDLGDDFDVATLDSIEEKSHSLNEDKNVFDEDNISSEEFKNLAESSSNDEFSFENNDNELDLSGITEMQLSEDHNSFNKDDSKFSNNNEDESSSLDKFEFEESNDIFNTSETEKDSFSSSFDNFDDNLDDKKIDDIDFESLPSNSFQNETESNHLDDEFTHDNNDLEDEWNNDSKDGVSHDHDFDNENLDDLLDNNDEPTIIPVPVPVKESFFSKIKNKFSKKKDSIEEEHNDNLNLKASRDEDESSYINLDSDLDNEHHDSLLSDEDEANKIEDENKKKANKGNIIKLSALAIIIAAVAGGYYYIKNSETGIGISDDSDNSELIVKKPVNMQGKNTQSLSGNDNIGNTNMSAGASTTQVADLKKELMSQITADKVSMEQRLTALEKENTMLKSVINQVQSSIDPDQINRFKIEFNDLNSKTKQLDVQFADDQSANKVMATNFFAVVKKLNEDIIDIRNTTARQDSLDEQTKRVDNTFKQFVKMKDKAAEDNIPYRVDLIEKRMKFRNPNGDRTFEDKNNVRKVLSEGLFEGDTVKQEQPIPDVKYKYSFVGMIEGVIYLKNQSGDTKDFKVGDVLPGYGEVLKINENGSVETEKLGTVSFK